MEPVDKIAVPKSVKQMANKIVGFRRTQAASRPVPGGGAARGAGQAVGGLIATPTRAVGTTAVVSAAGAGTYEAGKRKERQPSQDPMAVGKAAPDITWAGTFSKFDEDKRLAFGWASVVEKDGIPVVDRQGDYIAPEDMETAAYVYVQKSRVGGNMHQRDHNDKAIHVSDLVESVVFTKEKIAKMGLPDTTPIGWWVGYKIHDDEVWESVKKGGHTGFSIHGRGRRKETSIDEVMKEHR